MTQGARIVPVQAPNTTGDVYFKVLEFFDNAVHRLLQGQTASSGDGGGLSKDNAQDKVRQDILESDVEYLADVINAQLAVPWCRFNFGAAPVPKLTFDVAPPEDKEKNANTLKTLYEAGFEADEEEVSERFGYKLRRRAPDNPAMPGMAETTQEDADAAHTLNLKQKYDAMGVAIRAGLLTSDPEIEEQTRRELNLPPMSEAVRKAWEATEESGSRSHSKPMKRRRSMRRLTWMTRRRSRKPRGSRSCRCPKRLKKKRLTARSKHGSLRWSASSRN